MCCALCFFVFFSSRRRHTRCALVTGVQTCALPILHTHSVARAVELSFDWLRAQPPSAALVADLLDLFRVANLGAGAPLVDDIADEIGRASCRERVCQYV